MILHALTQYYQRKAAAGGDVAPEGFEYKEIPFIIILDKQGHFIQLEDTRGLKGKKKVGRSFLVPKGLGRSGKNSYQVSNILWDHYGYVLAYAGDKEQEQANKQHASFIAKVHEIKQSLPDDEGVAAVAAFLSLPEEKQKVMQSDNWAECAKIKGANLSFRLVSEASALVCQSKTVQNYLAETKQTETDALQGVCLVTGQKSPIARLHNPIKGVNAKPSPFTSVNLSAFESYGKEQGFIFPVGEQAMFEYTTALNTLLAGENRFRIGDVTTVCWSEKPTPLETSLPVMLNGGSKDNPDAHIGAVKALYKSLYNGKYSKPDGEDKFYLLGLSPNVARVVVRFWHETTVAELSQNIALWYQDLQMVRGEKSPYPEFMPLMRLLSHLVLDGKTENLPSDLIAQVELCALNNRPLPVSLLQMALRRNKAEQKVTYGRASLIKAYLNRSVRARKWKHIKHFRELTDVLIRKCTVFERGQERKQYRFLLCDDRRILFYLNWAVRAGRLKNTKELDMSLDRNRSDIGYVLGRLFAVLEHIQSEANPKLNATIGDRYFGAASSTPVAVFGTLLRLTPHHLNKLIEGRAVHLKWEIRQIMDKCQHFPSHLNLEQQGLFAVGYYHETQFLFTTGALKTAFEAETKTANQE